MKLDQTIAEFDHNEQGIDLRVYGTMTWETWNQLVHMVNSARLTVIKNGYVLPGDWVNGSPAGATEEYTKIAGRSVKRRLALGWKPVELGDYINGGDLIFVKHKGYVPADTRDIGCPVTEYTYYSVLRKS